MAHHNDSPHRPCPHHASTRHCASRRGGGVWLAPCNWTHRLHARRTCGAKPAMARVVLAKRNPLLLFRLSGGVPVAVGRTQVLWVVVPGTAAQHAARLADRKGTFPGADLSAFRARGPLTVSHRPRTGRTSHRQRGYSATAPFGRGWRAPQRPVCVAAHAAGPPGPAPNHCANAAGGG